MLDKARPIGYVVSEIIFMIFYGALALFLYSGWVDAGEISNFDIFTFSNIKIALLFSASFMALSGYMATLILVYFFYSRRLSWPRRAIVNSTLFLMHFAIFYLVVGESFSQSDFLLVIMGLICVAFAEATAGLLWRD